ncbi:MAG: hypothetical protein BWY23_02328 [Spirochaetes bacterium ADurb.Bin218]|nr:MAG: hypothetical protein BWY23_02328 [Spirochaetes bacterium ADurb.Bin218]
MSNIRNYDVLIDEIINKINSQNTSKNNGKFKVLFSNDSKNHTIESLDFSDSFDLIKTKWIESKTEFNNLIAEGHTIILFYIDFPKNSFVALYKGYSETDISQLHDLSVFITRNY